MKNYEHIISVTRIVYLAKDITGRIVYLPKDPEISHLDIAADFYKQAMRRYEENTENIVLVSKFIKPHPPTIIFQHQKTTVSRIYLGLYPFLRNSPLVLLFLPQARVKLDSLYQ